MLINKKGYWLKGRHHEEEWGFVLGKPEATFQEAYPEAWRRIQASSKGQFFTRSGLLTFAKINFDENLMDILNEKKIPIQSDDVWILCELEKDPWG